MKNVFKPTTLAAALAMAGASSLTVAQDGSRPAPVVVVTTPTTTSTVPPKDCKDMFVGVELDVTGSFVDHILNKDLFKNSVKNLRTKFPRLCIGSEVKVAIIGHSHRDVSGTYDHLASETYTITRNYYTADNIASTVVKQLEKWRDELASGKMKQQENTAVAMSFDHISAAVRNAGKPCMLFAITDADETEYTTGVPLPNRPGLLANCKVYIYGAGITLIGGNEAQRKLQAQWERHMKVAGVAPKDFFWLPNP